jgi:hypothetical protein
VQKLFNWMQSHLPILAVNSWAIKSPIQEVNTYTLK